MGYCVRCTFINTLIICGCSRDFVCCLFSITFGNATAFIRITVLLLFFVLTCFCVFTFSFIHVSRLISLTNNYVKFKYYEKSTNLLIRLRRQSPFALRSYPFSHICMHCLQLKICRQIQMCWQICQALIKSCTMINQGKKKNRSKKGANDPQSIIIVAINATDSRQEPSWKSAKMRQNNGIHQVVSLQW